MTTTPHVGVLAVQGGVAEHAAALTAVGAQVTLIRSPKHLTGAHGPRIDALVLPGGESTTQDTLLRLLDLAPPIRALIAAGLPTLGTCAGLILLADRIAGATPGHRTLGGLDLTVSRNAWGPQLASTEALIEIEAREFTPPAGSPEPVRGAFIRAPEIVAVGPGARVIARYRGRIVGATSLPTPHDSDGSPETPPLGNITGIAFHPELSFDYRFHSALTEQASARLQSLT